MGLLQDYFEIIQIDIADTIGAIWSFIIHNIVWRISGIHSQLQDIKNGKEKVYTAQVLNVWYTLPGNIAISPYTFLFTHDHIAPAETILRDNVHLLGFEKDVVKFIELDAKSDIFNLRKNPILFISQVAHTRKIIVLPRREFTRILHKNYVDGAKVVWCFHSIRCGSTVWAQMFAALPNWVAYSEPRPMFYSILRTPNILNVASFAKTEEYERMVVASIKMHILTAPKGHSIFWKSSYLDLHMVPIIKKHFPSHNILFAYRDCLPCASSYYKAFGNSPVMLHNLSHVHREILHGIENLSSAGRDAWLGFTDGYNSQFCLQLVKKHRPQNNAFEWFVLLWAVKVSMMMEFRKDGIFFKALNYDGLQKDAVGIITELFEHLNIPLDLVEIAHKSMELDSQAGTFFSRNKRVEHQSWLRTPDSDRRCNSILKAFGLPELDSQLEI